MTLDRTSTRTLAQLRAEPPLDPGTPDGLRALVGRIAEVNGVLDSATRDAARVASVAPNYAEAQRAATQTVRDEITHGSTTCRDTLRVTVSDNYAAGNTILVRASCTYPISDAGVPGAPGSLTVTSQFSTVIDPNRTIR